MIIGSEEEAKLLVLYEKVRTAYKHSDDGRWEAARWCAKVVGKYEEGATAGLADYMGVSPDTIENMAHAYRMFIELCFYHQYRKPTRMARDMPTIFYSHFAVLHRRMKIYKMTIHEVFDILRDIYLDEGGISSRDIDKHIRDKLGKEKDWMFYAERVQKAIASALASHDLPKEGRDLYKQVFNWNGDNVIGDKE